MRHEGADGAIVPTAIRGVWGGWAQAVGAEFSNRTPDQVYQFAKKHCLHLNNSHTWTDDDRAELIACVALLPTPTQPWP